jgi:bla regulator protein blaR1
MSWLFDTIIATAMLMALVLLIRVPVARLFGPRIAYLLWLAPLLRMMTPPLPADWFGTAEAATAVVPTVSTLLIPTAPVTATAAPIVTASMDWAGLAIAFWVAGALIFFIGHAFSYADFTRRAKAKATGLMEADGIPVIASPLVPSPVALGLFRPLIIVPVDFLWRYDAEERRLALAHELVHHRRRDLAANLAALAILSLHWWNPLAYAAFRAFRLDQEAACDAVVLATSDAADRRAYGNALYKSAAGSMPLAVCALGSASQLKARLRLIARSHTTALPLGGLAAVIVTIAGGVVATASTVDAPIAVAAKAPAIIALNGVTIDTDRPEVKEALAKADEADAIADKAAADIEAAAGQIEAQAGKIEADAARIEAESASVEAVNAADEARKAAEIARRDAQRAVVAASKCEDGSPMRAQVINRGRENMHVMLCGRTVVDQRAIREEVAQGLRSARDDIARDRDMPESIRSKVMASLDRQLARLRGSASAIPEPPLPPAPPAPPALPDGSAARVPPAPPAPPETSRACPTGTRHVRVSTHSDKGRSTSSVSCDGKVTVTVLKRR